MFPLGHSNYYLASFKLFVLSSLKLAQVMVLLNEERRQKFRFSGFFVKIMAIRFLFLAWNVSSCLLDRRTQIRAQIPLHLCFFLNANAFFMT